MTAAEIFVSFIVPCFNEEGNVESTVNSIRTGLSPRTDYEIVLVDDCSHDGTLARMQALAAADRRLHVVYNASNLGIGGAYKRGVANAQGHYAILVPGDDGFPADGIRRIIACAGQADIVIPVVTNAGVRTTFRAFASRGFTVLMNWLFWLNVGYYNGAVLHRTALLRTIEITTDGFAYQAEALVKLIARGASYTHCQVSIRERAVGRSTALRLKTQLAVWRTILHLLCAVGLFRKIRPPLICLESRQPRN